MKTKATKERKLLSLAAVLLVAALLAAPTAEATRYLPEIAPKASTPVFLTPNKVDQVDAEAFWLFAETDVRLFSILALLDASEIEHITAENRIRLFEDSGAIPRPVELAAIRKLASGVLTCDVGSNIWKTGGLAEVCGSPSFQGLWTDPTTGIAYARNRWYDARNASWLSEDPLGAVDSVNLYAFVGWGPHMGRDPMGLGNEEKPWINRSIDYLSGTGWVKKIRGFFGGVDAIENDVAGVVGQIVERRLVNNAGIDPEVEDLLASQGIYRGRMNRPGQYSSELAGTSREIAEKGTKLAENVTIDVLATKGMGKVGRVVDDVVPDLPNKTKTSKKLGPLRDKKGQYAKDINAPIVRFDRSSQYPHRYQPGVRDRVIAKHTNEAGEVIHPETGAVIPKDKVTIEHNYSVVTHWNERGFNMNQKQRADWYNNEDNLTVLPGPGKEGNSARGALLNEDFRQNTGPDYSR